MSGKQSERRQRSPRAGHVVRTIDAHAGGGPLRLVVEGAPVAPGLTMQDKRDWAARHADWLRRTLIFEPRGHAGMCAAVLTEPTTAGADAGVLFMDASGWVSLSGHGALALATVCLRERLIVPRGNSHTVVFDTPAGRVSATASGRSLEHVSLELPPSFVLHPGLPIPLEPRVLRADVAFGGVFLAIVDSETAGLSTRPPHLPDLARGGAEIVQAVGASVPVVHPIEPGLKGVDWVLFTGPATSPTADLRGVAVAANGQVDRSPPCLGLASLLAVLDAMGVFSERTVLRVEGPLGGVACGRIIGRTQVGDSPAVVTQIEGSAWITGQHRFTTNAADPFVGGFLL